MTARTAESHREFITIEHFMNLSAEINYHISARVPNEDALLALVLGEQVTLDQEAVRIALRLVRLGYADARRKIGPRAVLHPLRTAALLARVMNNPTALDLLGAMLHDKDEDLTFEDIPEENREEFTQLFNLLLDKIGKDQRWYLSERIALLTKSSGQPYHEYLVNLIDHSDRMPDLLHVKLADRLDNTLDQHIHRPGVLQYNFYRNVFDLLFVSVYKGVKIRQYHFLPEPEEGALLMAQLFKNALFLSLVRLEKGDRIDDTTRRLFDAIAVASIREAQWLGLELIAAVEELALPKLRDQIIETMQYCYTGGATQVHESDEGKGLAGIFMRRYALASGKDRRRAMRELYEDPDYLVTVVITFIATFASFLNDPDFSLEGITREGIHPVGRWEGQ